MVQFFTKELFLTSNTGKLMVCWKESEVAQSCLTLCNPMDCSLSGSSVHGIFQARVLEWIAISFSRGSSQPRNWTRVSRIVSRHLNICFNRQLIDLVRNILFLPNGNPLQKPHCFFFFLNGCMSTEELMLLNCVVGEDSWESLGLQGDPTSPFWRRSALGFLWKEWC